MNKIQQKYSAFMESVCTQFNCKQALPALKQGFKAFCEAVDVDYDPFDIDNMVANASDAEFGAENNDSRYNIDRFTGQGSEEFDGNGTDDYMDDTHAVQALCRRLQHLFDTDYNGGLFKVRVTQSDDEPERFFIEVSNPMLHAPISIGFGHIRNGKGIVMLPGRRETGAMLFNFTDKTPERFEFFLDDPQIAEKIAQRVYAVAADCVKNYQREKLNDRVNYANAAAEENADMNDTDFIEAMRNRQF
jgi:hypothetical protein